MKGYRVDFYQADIGGGNQPSLIGRDNRYQSAFDALGSLSHGNARKPIQVGGRLVQLREIAWLENRSVLKGVVARFHRDVPKKGIPEDEEEHDIQLKDRERLIDKTHFISFQIPHERNPVTLLVVQSHRAGPTHDQFSECLGKTCRQAVELSPVMQRDAYTRLLSRNARPVRVSFQVSLPRNAELVREIQGNPLCRHVQGISGDYGGVNVAIEVWGDRKRSSVAHRLKNAIKSDVAGMAREREFSRHVKKAKAVVEEVESGERHIVDLIADRLYGHIEVEMEGNNLYPSKESIFEEMCKVAEHNADVLKGIYGARPVL